MLSLLKRQRDLLLVAALLLFPLFRFLSSGHRGREPNLVDRVVIACSTPVQRLLTWGLDSVSNTVGGYIALRGAREEANAMRSELSQTRAELNSLREASLENERLKKMLGYAEKTVPQEIPARIIGINSSPQFLSVRIDRGQPDGIRVGMPVVTPDGVVGQIVQVTGSASEVMLLSDPASHVAATVQRSRVRATASGAGDGNKLALENVVRDSDVIEGDLLATSGTDGIFPADLVIGRVEEVFRAQTGMFLSARVLPAVNLRRVEEVFVVPVQPGDTPSALVLPKAGRR